MFILNVCESLIGSLTWFGCRSSTHVVCLGQELPSRAHSFPYQKLVWIQFSFSYTGYHIKFKESSLLYYLPIGAKRIVRFILFPRVLALCEMPTASFRIWTWLPKFTSHKDDCYTMTTSFVCIYVVSKVGEHSREWPECSLFNSYYTKM